MSDIVPVTITSIRQVGPRVKVFTLTPVDDPLHFSAGQWVDCYVEIDGELLVGGYSLTSSPLEGPDVELAIKQAHENRVTRYLHERAEIGEEVTLAGGQGDCYYQAGMAEALLLVAAGIGITPLISILRYAARAEPELPITLLYGAHSAAELIFRPEIEQIAQAEPITCQFTISGTGEGDRGGKFGTLGRGRIDRELLRSAGIPRGALAFICGPSEMIDDTSLMLAELGVERARLRFEKWW